MPPGTRNVFDATTEQFREWNRGDPLTAEHLNDVPTKLNKARGINRGFQVRPAAGGVGVSSGAVVLPDQPQSSAQFQVLSVTEIQDAIRCWRWGVAGGRTPFIWVIMQPRELQRKWIEYDDQDEAPFVYEGRRHVYADIPMWERNIRRRVFKDSFPDLWEWQSILPAYTTGAIFGSIVSAQRVSLAPDDKVFKRENVQVQMEHFSDTTAYARFPVWANSGQGDLLPPKDLYAVLNVQAKSSIVPTAPVMGQVYNWDEGVPNPTLQIQPGHGIEADPDNPEAPVLIDITWSWRYVADADSRAWAREWSQG